MQLQIEGVKKYFAFIKTYNLVFLVSLIFHPVRLVTLCHVMV